MEIPARPCIALIAEARVGALTELSGSGAREGAVEAVDLGQQQDILPGIAAVEGSGRGAAAVLDASGPSELGDQPGHLGPRTPRHLAQVAPDQALVGLTQAAITEAAQGLGDEVVGGFTAGYPEAHGLAAFEEGADLLQCLEPFGL